MNLHLSGIYRQKSFQRFGRRYGLSFGFITGEIGAIEVILATKTIGGSAGSLLSGVIVAFSGFGLLVLIGTLVVLLLIPIMIWVHLENKRSDKELTHE